MNTLHCITQDNQDISDERNHCEACGKPIEFFDTSDMLTENKEDYTDQTAKAFGLTRCSV